MTHPWTIAESRLIAEKVMEWQVTEINGMLFLADSEQRPDWLTTCAIPDWPRNPAAAAMVLAAWLGEGGHSTEFRYAMEPRQYVVKLIDRCDMRYPVAGISRDWAEAVMLAILAAVRG